MKLSKKAIILLVICVFVILVAGLGMTYSRQEGEQSQLDEELTLAKQRLEKYPDEEAEFAAQQKELESRLARAESRLRAAKANLYQSIESIEASDTLFTLAQDCGVEVVKIQSPGVTTKKIGEVTLSALSLTVTIEGDVLNIIDFVSEWTKEYPTGIVESVVITVPQPPDAEAEEAQTEEKSPSADIDICISTYEGK